MRRIMIDASKCDGCKNCTIACMQAHRETPGTVYDLDLTDIRNESRNHIEKLPDGTYRPIFCRHCDQPECVMSCMSGALTKDPKTGLVSYDETKMWLLLYVRYELPVRRPQSRYCHPYQSRKVRLLPAGRCRTQLRKSLSKTGNLC